MKLIRISAHGFKSFADKITIDIKDGITGIVGPNGSGKSNIVDAVKWVLGEQSLKDIRGGNTSSDVIFAGSKSRSPLTRAWVSLTFNNEDHYLNSDLKEIEIKRVVYRTGENEYYINNELVRLKDITNLFIDSGTSAFSLSIISQGKIGEIINSKPEDKRSIIEEAAGVLKYKKRKEESLRKLAKTNDNLEKINLIISELEVNLAPLKEQAETAQKYVSLKKELEQTEIGLLVKDIREVNENYTKNKSQKDFLDREIIKKQGEETKESTRITILKNDILKIDEEISKTSDSLYQITNKLSSLSSEKQIMLERKKLNADDNKLETNILTLKESELKLKKTIELLEEERKNKEEELNKKLSGNAELVNELKKANLDKQVMVSDLTRLNREEASLKNKIDILKENIENDNKLPYAVRTVMNNHRLVGIKNVLGKLIETDERYSTAIDVSLGSLSNIIVTENEMNAKDAVSYLKQTGAGRATFYPLNVIKPRRLDDITLSKIENDTSFVGTAASLVKYDPVYKNVALNVLGNVIIADNLVNANRLSKMINHMYKIVTLEGDIVAAGGSITGGSLNNKSGFINQKFELEKSLKILNELSNSIKTKEDDINQKDNEISILEERVFASNNVVNILRNELSLKLNEANTLRDNLLRVTNEINGNQGLLNGSIEKEVEKILNEYYEVSAQKEKLEISLANLKVNKNDLSSELSELELSNKKQNSEYNKLANELNEVNIQIGKCEIKLDNYLLRLNEEYGLTYERAKNEYSEPEEADSARTKVNSIKRDIRALGEVNTGAISEYERINERYTFLSNQKEEISASVSDLLKVIDELDSEMVTRLTDTFDKLNKEFQKTFTRLFRGGEGSLILTNPDDILNSGLEIKALPPGKDIKNTKLLSGGESTLTAIALLFAMLNIRTVPFCILDEVEAALDEANVDMFGKYLEELNTNTQFIIITHKKRTMEYADNLYGITMQESGVSKLVSVKLD